MKTAESKTQYYTSRHYRQRSC